MHVCVCYTTVHHHQLSALRNSDTTHSSRRGHTTQHTQEEVGWAEHMAVALASQPPPPPTLKHTLLSLLHAHQPSSFLLLPRATATCKPSSNLMNSAQATHTTHSNPCINSAAAATTAKEAAVSSKQHGSAGVHTQTCLYACRCANSTTAQPSLAEDVALRLLFSLLC